MIRICTGNSYSLAPEEGCIRRGSIAGLANLPLHPPHHIHPVPHHLLACTTPPNHACVHAYMAV